MPGTLAKLEENFRLLWYLMDGSHDLARFLIQDVRTPVRVEKVQLFNQPVVLPQEERVQRNHSQVFVSSGITWEKFYLQPQAKQNRRGELLTHQPESRTCGCPEAQARGSCPLGGWSFGGHRGPDAPACVAGRA